LLIYKIIDIWTSSLVRFRPIQIRIFGKFDSKFLQRVAAYQAGMQVFYTYVDNFVDGKNKREFYFYASF